jgi:O-antigen ligase
MVLFYLLVVVMTLIQHQFWGADIGALTPVKYLGGACMAMAIYRVVQTRQVPPILSTIPARLFLLFAMIAGSSWIMVGERDPLGFGFSPAASYLSFLMLLFIVYVLVDNSDRLRWTVLAAISSTVVASLYVLREAQKGSDRPGWVAGDANYFTISVVLVFPLALYLASGKYPLWQRLYCGGSVLIMTAATMLAASRGGFLALLAAGVMLIGRSKNWLRYVIVLVVLLVSAVLLAPVSPWQRLVNPTHSDQEASDIRLNYWRIGGRMIAANPFFGVGLGNFKPVMPTYKTQGDVAVVGVAHNIYVETAAELGLPAAAILLAFLLSTLLSLNRSRKRIAALRKTPEIKPLQVEFLYDIASGIQAGVAGSLVSLMFASGLNTKLLWLMLFLGLRLASLVPKGVASTAETGAGQQEAAETPPYAHTVLIPSARP